MTEGKAIRIQCTGTRSVNIAAAADFQGRIKTISRGRLDLLKQSIVEHGFTAPVFVWVDGEQQWIIDGHQRSKALQELSADGYDIPDVPVVDIYADDAAEAARKLLVIGSQYGEFDPREVVEWARDGGVDVGTVYASLMQVSDDAEFAASQAGLNLGDFFDSLKDQEAKAKGKERVCPFCGAEFRA